MNLSLKRDYYREDGIFSTCTDPVGGMVMSTLEHAYGDSNGYLPKISPGTYTCVRSKHRLHGMTHDFETFEITGVFGHSNLLFHWGNFNDDSEGCILTGEKVLKINEDWMVTNSRVTFAKFMGLQKGINEFQLTVIA